jgi:parvulin-like peptidyl-prolyl isomerase
MIAEGTPPRTVYRSTTPRPYTRWNFYLLLGCLALLIATAAGVLLLAAGLIEPPARRGHTSRGAGDGEMRRELAGRLLSVGLVPQAIEQYRLYLSENDLPATTAADVAFTIGKLYADQGKYEDALSWLYQVEMLDPKTPHKDEVGSKIVLCLERLGKFSAAGYTLDARTSPQKSDKKEFKGSKAVATIGSDTITLEELDRAVDALPDWMREELKEPAKKEEFLKQYVAEELLFRKAKRLEYDKDPQVRTQAEMALRHIMIQKVLEKEVKDKVALKDDDISLYYKAHQDRYSEKEAVKVRLLKAADKDKAAVVSGLAKGRPLEELIRQYSIDERTKDKGGAYPGWVEKGSDPFGTGNPEALWEALSRCKRSEVTAPVKAEGGWYFFEILERRSERTPPFEEVKDRVKQDLYRERIEKAYQDLIQETLQASDVQLFPEHLKKSQ